MLNRDGWVSTSDPIRRDRKTKLALYEDESAALSVDEEIESWVNGLIYVLNKKKRANNYGRGAILGVYAYGMSGDFGRPPVETTISDVIERVPTTAFANGFDQTFVFSWYEGWCREVTRPRDA